MIEFIYNPQEDTIVMGVECDDWVMGEGHAKDVARSWADELERYIA
jgi:hypothetical protein